MQCFNCIIIIIALIEISK